MISKSARLLLCLISILLSSNLYAQKKIDYRADWSDKIPSMPDEMIMTQNVMFEHEGMKMYCDSAIFNEKENRFEAFGNIFINQKDTLKIWGDELYYDGQTKIGELYGETIRMEDHRLMLETDYLILERIPNTISYNNWAYIYDSISTLKSQIGVYDLSYKEFVFTNKVEIYSDSSYVYSDTMTYNSRTKLASFYGPTQIISKDSTLIYTELGLYNTQTETSKSFRKGRITNESRLIIADSLEYDSKRKYGVGLRNILIEDSVNSLIVTGHNLYINNNDSIPYSFITERALCKYYDKGDTLYIHSDTILIHYDTSMNLESINLFERVKFYREDFQGYASRIDYNMSDSLLYMTGSPVVWDKETEISSDTIRVLIKNEIYNLKAYYNAFLIQIADTMYSDRHNQVKGREIEGYFEDNNIYLLEVNGNSQLLYYIYEEKDDENELIGINIGEGSEMKIYFEDKKINKLTTINKPNFYADDIDNIPESERFLKGYKNRFDKRPKSPEEVFDLE